MNASSPLEIRPVILQNMLDNLPVGLMVINAEGEIVTINRAASTILGYDLDAFEGKGWGELFVENEKNDDFNQIIVDIIWEKQVNLRRSVSYTRTDGRVLHLSITGSFLMEGEAMAGIVVLLNDVTELHEAHKKEKAVLREMNALQREKAESMSQLAQAVAHQIRNPVSAIGGFSMRMLNEMDSNDPNRPYVKTILDGTKRLEAIVREVGAYTQASQVSPRPTPVDEILETAKAAPSTKAAELSREISWTISSKPVEIIVDPELFGRALIELFLNSVEFCNASHVSIAVSVSMQPGRVNVEVKDTGSGIPEKDMPYIFDPFFTTKAVGVGMGLCRARRIISEHKGEIRVDNTPGQGTTVMVRLPNYGMDEKGES